VSEPAFTVDYDSAGFVVFKAICSPRKCVVERAFVRVFNGQESLIDEGLIGDFTMSSAIGWLIGDEHWRPYIDNLIQEAQRRG
jgi:hypothetical protein